MRVLQLKEDSVASAEGVVSIMADKSLVGRTSWGKRVCKLSYHTLRGCEKPAQSFR